jgi:hypothetical protein
VFRRPGRVINGILECGERYEFTAPGSRVGERLREFSLRHAELTESAALSVARQLTELAGPPDNAEPYETLCIDCGDRGRLLVGRRWTVDNQVNRLEVYLQEGTGTFVIALTWSQRQE